MKKKKKLNEDLQARKIVLRNKVTNILESRNYVKIKMIFIKKSFLKKN